MPTLTYGCETWVLLEREIKNSSNLDEHTEDVGVTRLDHMRNELVRERLRV